MLWLVPFLTNIVQHMTRDGTLGVVPGTRVCAVRVYAILVVVVVVRLPGVPVRHGGVQPRANPSPRTLSGYVV